jgi:hypothetical protein
MRYLITEPTLASLQIAYHDFLFFFGGIIRHIADTFVGNCFLSMRAFMVHSCFDFAFSGTLTFVMILWIVVRGGGHHEEREVGIGSKVVLERWDWFSAGCDSSGRA